ncbi:MAG TPA: glutamate--cysteine ligase [Pseudomonadales bacterium]|nr:glutamate--cysteine ligase [Pseudomonadales bacterium]
MSASQPDSLIDALLADPADAGLKGIRRGIEKESLRVSPDGVLAQTPHPLGLGSALTHPHITTDFSEALIELITDAETEIDATLGQLEEVHGWVYRQLGEEILWAASMPCVLRGDDRIPLGYYGTSNVGTAKTVYRRGLGHRYGRTMQTIAGIHYNFSVPEAFWAWLAERTGWSGSLQDLATERYFGLIRNFRRTSWLLMYLFGASPAVCKSFLAGREHGLEPFDEGSLYLPHATTLRMGGLGYQSDAQSSLHVSYNSLETYAASLRDALTRPWPEYEAIGLEQDGEFQQLSTSLLQIENEFYGTIRPKRTTAQDERPLHALGARGVEYIEVRCMDVNPFLPLGIDTETIHFLDAFLLHCLLTDAPEDSPEEIEVLQRNRTAIVERGREPGLQLEHDGELRSIAVWGQEILDDCTRTAAALDAIWGDDAASRSVAVQRARLEDSRQTPSARILEEMRRDGIPFFRFAMNASLAHAEHFRSLPLAAETVERLQAESRASLERQGAIEAADDIDFATYRRQFIDQPLIPGAA